MADDTTTELPSPGFSLIFFLIITSGYFVYRYASEGGGGGANTMTATMAYFLLTIIGQFFLNNKLLQAICGESQWATSLSITLIPWVLIFGLLLLFLNMFPSWRTPFSNTFGLFVAKMLGVKDLVSKMFDFNKLEDGWVMTQTSTAPKMPTSPASGVSKVTPPASGESKVSPPTSLPKVPTSTTSLSKVPPSPASGVSKVPTSTTSLSKVPPSPASGESKVVIGGASGRPAPNNKLIDALANIKIDNSIIINEFNDTPADDALWSALKQGGFLTQNADNLRPAFQKVIHVKTLVADFVWFVLTGMLVTTVSYNYIVNSGCKTSLAEMKKRHEDYEDEMTQATSSAADTTQRVYNQT